MFFKFLSLSLIFASFLTSLACMPIVHWPSINQEAFESSEHNTVNGSCMCGTFAVYNGLNRLKAINENHEIIYESEEEEFEDCKIFLEKNRHIFEGFKKNGWLNKTEVEILLCQQFSDKEFTQKQILGEKTVQKHPNGMYVIEMDYFKNNPYIFLDISAMTENRSAFNPSENPQLVIMRSDKRIEQGHYVALVIEKEKTWVMDSLGFSNHHDEEIKNLVNFFYNLEKLSIDEIKKLKQDAVKSISKKTQEETEIIEISDNDEEKNENVNQPSYLTLANAWRLFAGGSMLFMTLQNIIRGDADVTLALLEFIETGLVITAPEILCTLRAS